MSDHCRHKTFISWGAVPDADFYEVEHTTPDGATSTATVYQTAHTLTALAAGSHRLRVQARNRCGGGPWSVGIVLDTTATAVTQGQPRNLEGRLTQAAGDPGERLDEVKWEWQSPVAGPAPDGYIIQIDTLAGTLRGSSLQRVSGHNVVVDVMPPPSGRVRQRARIRSVRTVAGADVLGLWTGWVEVAPGSAPVPTVPGVPRNLGGRITEGSGSRAVRTDSVRWTWDAPAAGPAPTGYHIWIVTVSGQNRDGDGIQYVSARAGRSYTSGNLKPPGTGSVVQRARIRALHVAGSTTVTGPWTDAWVLAA